MEINLQNIEELLFFDKRVHKILPEFRHLFDQWQLSKRISGMTGLGRRVLFDLLNALNGNHLKLLAEYFNEEVLLDKVDPRIVRNHESSIHELENLCEFSGFKEFCIHRNKDNLKISFWR